MAQARGVSWCSVEEGEEEDDDDPHKNGDEPLGLLLLRFLVVGSLAAEGDKDDGMGSVSPKRGAAYLDLFLLRVLRMPVLPLNRMSRSSVVR